MFSLWLDDLTKWFLSFTMTKYPTYPQGWQRPYLSFCYNSHFLKALALSSNSHPSMRVLSLRFLTRVVISQLTNSFVSSVQGHAVLAPSVDESSYKGTSSARTFRRSDPQYSVVTKSGILEPINVSYHDSECLGRRFRFLDSRCGHFVPGEHVQSCILKSYQVTSACSLRWRCSGPDKQETGSRGEHIGWSSYISLMTTMTRKLPQYHSTIKFISNQAELENVLV